MDLEAWSSRLKVLADATRWLAELERLPGAPGPFTATYCDAARYLHGFVEDMKASGSVAASLNQHGIQGASVAPAATAP